MSTHPPADPAQDSPPDSFRTAANRRIFVFVTIFTLLLIGAVALVMREEKRRGSLVIQPELPAPPEVVLPAPAPALAPTTPAVEAPARPVSPALQQSRQMEIALAAFREAGDHLIAKRFQQAEERASAALKAYPKMAAAQRMLGLIYLQQGRINQSIGVLELSLRNEPFHPEALSNLAFAYLQNQNPGLAMELIETCRRLHPDFKPALLQHGIMLLTQDDASQEAVEILREAVEAFPRLPGPRNNLAVALARQGDREGAREQLTILLEMKSNNFSALFNMGALYAQETNAVAAMPWIRKSMTQMPPEQFRNYLNDPDLEAIRETPEFLQLLQELDPAFPGQQPPR
jgi:tetratricopeptide (TPR) repeat protein